MPTYAFTRILQNTLSFTTDQVRILSEEVYDTQYVVLYWQFSEIKEWRQSKANIPVSCGGIYFGARKVKCLQELAWWVTDLMMRGKID